jgi:hypothetical protein
MVDAPGTTPCSLAEIDRRESAFYRNILGTTVLTEIVGFFMVSVAAGSIEAGSPGPLTASNFAFMKYGYVFLAVIAIAPLVMDAMRRGRTDTLLHTDEQP